MDGYVYQNQMHWNVISDEPAKCPICEMQLKRSKFKREWVRSKISLKRDFFSFGIAIYMYFNFYFFKL